jgi:SAM-dependent methyltransferase
MEVKKLFPMVGEHCGCFMQMLKLRRLNTHAKFLLPFLKPDMKVLDCGCGPGALTIDFALCVPHGEVIGIDIDENQLAIARQDARNADLSNVAFQNANVFNLPFADNTFDLVFSHALLGHVKDPLAAVLEQKRVVKHGGIIAARNYYTDGITFYPNNSLLEEATRFQMSVIAAKGGDPNFGIKLGELFREAGLSDVAHNMFCDTSTIAEMALFSMEENNHHEYSQELLRNGVITLEKLEAYQKAWTEFMKTPHAFSYFPWGEVVGIKSSHH